VAEHCNSLETKTSARKNIYCICKMHLMMVYCADITYFSVSHSYVVKIIFCQLLVFFDHIKP